MENIFISLLNTSITAGYLVIAVMLLRPVLKKAPKYIRCILWGLVGLRLILPFSLESVLSLIPSAQPIPPEIVTSPTPTIYSGISLVNSTVNPVISQTMAPNPGDSVNPMQVVMAVAWNVWLLGVMAMVIYSIVSFLLLKRKLREAAKDSDNVWLCDRVSSPFLLGLFRPRIYLPSDLKEEDKLYVLAHENAHIRRKDHWWKPLGFFLLTVYWFNPLMWIAYIFLCRDIEFACDEKVIKALGTDCKKSYSEALINCSVPRKMISACPVAFGEDGVKGRIKSVLHYKKPAFWIILIALIVCIAVAVCFLTDPLSNQSLAGKYETGKCLYSNVVSKDKETETNSLIFDIHANGKVYKESTTENTELIGTRIPSEYTEKDLNNQLSAQSAGTKIRLGRIKNTYEILNASGQREYAFFQKANGNVVLVSFFSDGNIMNVFKLKKSGECERVNLSHDYCFQAVVLEVYEDSLLVQPLNGDALQISDQIVVTIPEFTTETFQKDDWIEVGYDSMVQELYPPIISNVYYITNLEFLSSSIEPSELQTSFDSLSKTTEFDIDKDGIVERCIVSPGPTSGLFTIRFSVYENGILEYQNTFNTPWFDYAFRTLEDGTTVLAGETQQGQQLVYTIGIENNVIVLSEDTEKAAYWGDINQNMLSSVRQKYPHFLGLNTTKGLEVYVWQNGDWRCGVRSGTNRLATTEELWAFREGAALEEMALILSTYNITQEDVAILYSYDPAFSGEYPNVPTTEQQAYIEDTLFSLLPRQIVSDPYTDPNYPVQNTYKLVVCGSQFGENIWRFQIFKNATIFDSIRNAQSNMNGMSLESAKEMLEKYDYDPAEIPVVIIQHPLSSFLHATDEQATAEARVLLGLAQHSSSDAPEPTETEPILEPEPETTQNSNTLKTGFYFLYDSYTDLYATPYIYIDTEEKTASIGGSPLMSYAERGSYFFIFNRLIVKTQNTVYRFQLFGEDTLVLASDSGFESSPIPATGAYVFWGELPY